MEWAEFASWNPVAESWVNIGNIAVVPYLVQRTERGVSRYMIARGRKEFVAACDLLGARPSDLPRERASINIDGPFLMRAIMLCRRARLGPVTTAERQRLAFPAGFAPWESKCPECGLPFDRVASHTIGELVTSTSAACAAGHRWPV